MNSLDAKDGAQGVESEQRAENPQSARRAEFPLERALERLAEFACGAVSAVRRGVRFAALPVIGAVSVFAAPGIPGARAESPTAAESVYIVHDPRDPSGMSVPNGEIAEEHLDPEEECAKCVLEIRCPRVSVQTRVPFEQRLDRAVFLLGGKIEGSVRGKTLLVECQGDEGWESIEVPPYVEEKASPVPPAVAKAAASPVAPAPPVARAAAKPPAVPAPPAAPPPSVKAEPIASIEGGVIMPVASTADIIAGSRPGVYLEGSGKFDIGYHGWKIGPRARVAWSMADQGFTASDGRFAPVDSSVRINGNIARIGVGIFGETRLVDTGIVDVDARLGLDIEALVMNVDDEMDVAVDGSGALADLPALSTASSGNEVSAEIRARIANLSLSTGAHAGMTHFGLQARAGDTDTSRLMWCDARLGASVDF